MTLAKLTHDFIRNLEAPKQNFSCRHDAIEWAKRAYDDEGIAAVEILCRVKGKDDDGVFTWSIEDLKELIETFIGCFSGFDDVATEFLYHRERKFLELSQSVLSYFDDETVARDTLLADMHTATNHGGQYLYHHDDDGSIYLFRRPDSREDLNWMNHW